MTSIFPLWLWLVLAAIVLFGGGMRWEMRTRTSYGQRTAHINTPLGIVTADVCWAWSDERFIKHARKNGLRGILANTGAYIWIAPETIRAVSFR